MADYLVGGLLAVLFVFAARSYFGRKFGGGCFGGCSGCPHAKNCGREQK